MANTSLSTSNHMYMNSILVLRHWWGMRDGTSGLVASTKLICLPKKQQETKLKGCNDCLISVSYRTHVSYPHCAGA